MVSVFMSASADDAIRKLDKFKPDVIVADIGMPGEDGYSLIRKVRNSALDHSRLTPAIALTAYAGDGNRRRALDALSETYFETGRAGGTCFDNCQPRRTQVSFG
jgi:CheY-like chemotaxis protein